MLKVLDEGPQKNQTLEWTGWLTEGTKARTAESLAVMGFDGTDLSRLPNEVIAVVEDEEWTDKNGEKHSTPRVRWINDPKRGGARFAAMEPTQKQEMLAQLRGLILAGKKPESNTGTAFDFGANKPKF